MNEFSDVGSEVLSNNTINMIKIGSAALDLRDNHSIGVEDGGSPSDHEHGLTSGRNS